MEIDRVADWPIGLALKQFAFIFQRTYYLLLHVAMSVNEKVYLMENNWRALEKLRQSIFVFLKISHENLNGT